MVTLIYVYFPFLLYCSSPNGIHDLLSTTQMNTAESLNLIMCRILSYYILVSLILFKLMITNEKFCRVTANSGPYKTAIFDYLLPSISCSLTGQMNVLGSKHQELGSSF